MLNRTEVGNIGSTMLNGTVVSQAELGPLQGHIVLALTVAWILTFFCVFHGIGSIGWAVYLTTTVPYLMLIILLFRGLSLEGASEGVQYFLKPDLTKIWKSEVRIIFCTNSICSLYFCRFGNRLPSKPFTHWA